MSGLNIAIINNSFEALRYIEPKTDAENVLYNLLKDAEEKGEQVDEDVEDLKTQIEDLDYRAYVLENENKNLLAFFDKIVDAYNEKLGVSRNFDVDDNDFQDEIINMIKEEK